MKIITDSYLLYRVQVQGSPASLAKQTELKELILILIYHHLGLGVIPADDLSCNLATVAILETTLNENNFV